MVRTWHSIGAQSWGSRVSLPGRVAMGGRTDVLTGFGPPQNIRRGRRGSLYLDEFAPATWYSLGDFNWNCLLPCAE
jgi:hypothetical protein